jgi:hypothetical protein
MHQAEVGLVTCVGEQKLLDAPDGTDAEGIGPDQYSLLRPHDASPVGTESQRRNS